MAPLAFPPSFLFSSVEQPLFSCSWNVEMGKEGREEEGKEEEPRLPAPKPERSKLAWFCSRRYGLARLYAAIKTEEISVEKEDA